MFRRKLLALLAAATAAAAGTAAPAPAATPVPEVRGPLPVTGTSHPFGGAEHTLRPQELERLGYVEEEFLVSGRANVYDWPAPGPAVVRTPGAPYTTRVLVRRPRRGRDFSGTVVVEMLNPSNLFDLNIGWAMTRRQMVADGDAWVGITAKPIASDALEAFDPSRYSALNWANPLPLEDPRNCATQSSIIPGDTSRTTETGLVWDIHSQVGAWLKSRARSNPLRGGRAVRRLYGFGYSQTGGFLYTYINGVQPLQLREDRGRRIFDGYIVAVAGGAFAGLAPINQCAPPAPVGDPRRQFANVGVPVVHIMSQSDYLRGIQSRRPDSDERGDRFRHYEMAGAGHATPDELYFSAKPEDILRAGRQVPPTACNEGPRSRFPSEIFFDAALRNLDLWVRRGIAPPRVAPIEVRDGRPVLDLFGNVLGGLRSPYVDVPRSRWAGNSTGASFCAIAGHEVPLPEAQLRLLYPTREHYVTQVVGKVEDLVRRRVLTRADGARIIRETTAG